MKILYLNDDFPPKSFGGAGIVAYDFARRMKELGHDVHVITTTQDKNEQGYRIQDGLKVFRVYSRYHHRWRAYVSLYNPRTVRKVAKIIAEVKPDVIHFHNVHNHLSYHCFKIARCAQVPVFLTAHDMMLVSNGKIRLPEETTAANFMQYCNMSFFSQLKVHRFRFNPFRNVIIRHYLTYIDKVFCFSHAQERILKLNGIGNLTVIHSAINVSAYHTDPVAVAEFKKSRGLEGKKTVLFGGRVSVDKGIQQTLNALPLIAEKVPTALLVIAGVGTEGFDDLNLPIKFLGWLNPQEMKLAFAAADVVILPSICFDVFGMMVLEAMASHKPVVGTCFGGAPEAIIDGETGFVVNPRDTHDMAAKIASILEDDSLARRFGEAGFERVKNYFDANQQVEKVLHWYMNSIS